MTEAERLADYLDELFDADGQPKQAAEELRRLSAANAELLEALERIADPRNTHFAGDAQVVARAAIAQHTGEPK